LEAIKERYKDVELPIKKNMKTKAKKLVALFGALRRLRHGREIEYLIGNNGQYTSEADISLRADINGGVVRSGRGLKGDAGNIEISHINRA
jgi:hypothetical protein